jgi:hypothetical protein
MKRNKVGQDFNCTGVKYPCAISKEDVERLEVKRIGRVFWTACFIAYLIGIVIVICAIS